MAEENFEENNMGGIPEPEPEPETETENANSHPPEIQEPEKDSRGVPEKKWPGWPGENVFRMLVPVQKVGGIIGRKGEFIKKMCEETKARIKILEGPPGATERTVSSIKSSRFVCILKGIRMNIIWFVNGFLT